MKGFTFKKNDRGFSNITFPFMRKTIIPTTKLIFDPKITGRENMPQRGPCFIYGNHSNYFDPFMINVGMTEEPTAGVMTRDQFHKTLPRIFMDSIGIVPTSKYVPEPGIVRDVIRMIQQERMIVIFPEGGRRWDGRPKPFIETTLKLFWKMGIPVHPVQLHGSYLSWPRWADNYRRSSVENRWLKPLIPSEFESFEEFSKTCKELFSFDEYYPPETVDIHSVSKPASGIQRLLYRCPKSGETGSIYSPDGNSVYSRTSDLSYKMNKWSRLVDTHGEEHSIVKMFDEIKELPMEMDKESVLLKKLGCHIYIVNKQHERIDIGSGYCELKPQNLFISSGSQRFDVALDDIHYLSVEQNHKITLTTTDHTFQISLDGESALQWQIYIRRLQKGIEPIKKQ